jgi:hypothetical protein
VRPDVLLLWAVGVGLAGDALDDVGRLAAGEPPTAAGREQGAWAVTPLLQPLVQHGMGVALHGDEIVELVPFHLDAGTPLVDALVAVERQDLGDAEAGAQQHGQQGMVAEPLLCTRAGSYAQRLRGIEQAEFLQAREPFPVGGGLSRRFDSVRGAAEGEEAGEFAVSQRAKWRTVA